MTNNWYYFYDKRGIDERDLKDLSTSLEKIGYTYFQPQGLGAGPSPEQVILWLHNNQFISGVSVGIVSNYLYDLLKEINAWFKSHRYNNKAIPVVEIFFTFKDIKNNRISARFKYRIDKLQNKNTLKKGLQIKMRFLRSSSENDTLCSKCGKKIYKYAGFYVKRDDLNNPVCQDCLT